jgi:DNA modification methylase
MSMDLRRGDALEVLRSLPAGIAQTCVTSPPYWGLRDYGAEGQLGLEPTPEEYVSRMVEVFREVRRVLRDDGTLWLNLGDSYAGGTTGRNDAETIRAIDAKSGRRPNAMAYGDNDRGGRVARKAPEWLKPKDLVGIPWRVAFALQADGWYLRSDIIWSKPNPMPESVTDRPTKAHEYLFLLAKSERYYYDAEAAAEPVSQTPGAQTWRRIFDPAKQGKEAALKVQGVKNGNDGHRDTNAATRNRRSVWMVTTEPFPEAHFAVMPQALVEPCILAGSGPRDLVLDPFAGSGTVGVVALRHGRRFLGIELNQQYVGMARRRIAGPLFAEVS